ncbi:MAG: conjugal transfer protein TraX, partial [Ectothiorhodospiraceae bacterium]|nr:conjugal transfer protein TraX [Ectothiorhodospiraceae bacterium]
MTAITHSNQSVPASKPDSRWTGWAQWVALATMMVDHVVRHLFGHLDLGWASSSIGRIALPAFAGMVAWHALFNTRSPYRYASRILIIGLIAQPFYMMMPRGDASITLNVCFTLAAGLTAATWLRQLHDNTVESVQSAV